MSLHIALLRGINLGPRNAVSMADLRRVVEKLGHTEVRTFLNSGNLVFDARRGTGEALERQLEREVAKHLDLTTDFHVRTADEWRTAMTANPFTDEAERDPARLMLMCLKVAPSASAVRALREAIKGPEYIELKGRHLYAVYPAGMGQSRLTTALIDSTLATRSTARNWNTVRRLADAVGGEQQPLADSR
jgi:uncharacterized protein (DUF1697 family)